MNIVIPPLLFYVVGTLFVVIGALRAAMLGRRRAGREIAEETAAAAKARRYHLRLGIVYVLAGILLILLTSGVLRFRSPLH
jgi:hypothetical protein